jgi:cation transport regulator ChaC
MRRVWVFFYGSFMNPAVLAKADVHSTDRQMARLDGWELRIASRATIVPVPGVSVYGIVARLTHPEIEKLYTKDWFAFGPYVPEAVQVTPASGDPVPALCYVAWQLADGKPGREYLDKMLSVAREYSFPEDYVRRIQSFV